MKQLFRHTTTLLRIVLLFGALSFVNTQAKAQTAEQWAAMPDAFETMDPASIIGDGNYYYIQFYTPQHDNCSYLTDRGENKLAATMDFLPCVNNRLWTLESAGGNNFRLKSKAGYYIGFDRLEGASGPRYVSIANSSAATTFTFQQTGDGDGYNILDLDHGYNTDPNGLLGRYDGLEWLTELSIIRNNGTGQNNSRMRFAKLKSNAAFIIYYRGEGIDNSDPNVATTRHYLTYSGADSEIRTSVIYNGDFESAMAGGDMSCYLIGSPGNSTPQYATATQGAGNNNSKGVSITSSGNAYNSPEWDTQFFIRATDVIPVGKTIHVEFDYRASENTNIQIQAQAEPGNYRSTLGSLNFTTGWQRFSGDINVTNGMGNDIQTIAFNLWKGHAITYYFDNIVVTAPITTDVSSRRSIIPPNKPLCSLPTLAAYHQDGLWTLEETGTDGVFYIKRYGEEQYLTVRQINNDRYCTVLGNKDDVYGRFNLETPTNSRYTRIHNNCQYWGLQRYLSYSGGDGSPVIQGYDNNNPWWYAGFYPVEVPVPNKDEFFQVLVGANSNANMLNLNGGYSTYSEEPDERQLWQLEQIDDYNHFRLKDPGTGRYLRGPYQMTDPNDPTNAEINNNEKFWTDFSLKWYFVNPVPKEIPVDNYYVTHRESYLKQYAAQYSSLNLEKQGLATEADSQWKNWNDNLGGFTQKVNHFEITHYVKQDNSMLVEFPTVLTRRNDHVYFQRFYNYDEIDTQMDLDNLKAHVSLDDNDDGNVQYFLYKNGMVTGQKLDWSEVEDGSYARYALRRFNFTNSDGKPFTVAVDVSRYSDYTYANSTDHLDGDLEEPSLTMRYIYYMKDAKEMAANLTAKPYIKGSTNKDEWLEFKEIHFPAKQIAYEANKKVGYRGEFLGVRHIFSDYWVFDDPSLVGTYNNGMESGADLSELNNRLVSAVNDINGGKIEVEIYDPYYTGIRLGGFNPNIDLFGFNDGDDSGYKGFYFYDKMGGKTLYGNSRFVVFRYPADGEADASGPENPAYVNVYLKVDETTKYQLAQFKIIFDPGTETLPWKDVTIPVATTGVKDTPRDPYQLRKMCGKPIAKISFDYPDGDTYHYPAQGKTLQDGQERDAGGTIANSSPIPLTFDKTNYSFDGDNTNWGSYAMVGEKLTVFGKFQKAEPANHGTRNGQGVLQDESYGYAIGPDPHFKSAFLYIDASEQPGDICSAPFVGDFCSNDKLIFTGWITGSNAAGETDNRCPGGVTMTVKGEHMVNGKLETEAIYRFCPGQCYELDDNTEAIPNVSFGIDQSLWNKYHVVWQQFYFEFSVTEKYDRYWIEVNNNCVSSNGGDFMLDNIEVYAYVPEVTPDINTPVCVDESGKVDMRLLKLMMNFNKLKTSSGVSSGTAKEGFVFLEKEKFLTTLKAAKNYSGTLEELAEEIRLGNYILEGNDNDYKTAFNAALLREPGNTDIWDSNNPTSNIGAGVLYFQWDSNFNNMPLYTFAKAVEKQGAVFREIVGTGDDAENFIVMNGNFPQLPWKANTEYYIIPSNTVITDFSHVYETFNLCSDCSKASVFKIEPPLEVLGLDATENTEDLVACEGQIPTLLTNLKGYDIHGNELTMKNLNFDWWLGKKGDPTANPAIPPVPATLENYHLQNNGNGIKLDVALSTMRAYYPDITSLDIVTEHVGENENPKLTQAMINYLQELVDAGELVLHQSAISVPAEKVLDSDPYFYLVACPIHDEMYDQALNPSANEYVSFFCDEPQGVRIKLNQKAPTLQTGFVPGEHGFTEYNYNFPANTNPVLSIRLAKAAQFETVKNTETEGATPSTDVNYLWLPIRNAETESAEGVIRKADDDNIYLVSSNDLTWDKKIATEMNRNGVLPVVGRIVQLQAVNTKEGANVSTTENAYNRLSVYFNKDFNVREGYNYTLRLPFQEDEPDDEKRNACDGTILINLKIVPDYEVWTGAAGNIDWNNDENWRRADGNTTPKLLYDVYSDELYRANGAVDNVNSPLHTYTTNKDNYYSSATSKRKPTREPAPSSDQVLRKGFAPLYCTHVLMKSDEWGNAPELYDALDYKEDPANPDYLPTNATLNAYPFPNLRETSTPILKFDMQARRYDMWEETYGSDPDRGSDDRPNDLIAEMYQINSCDEIAFQPGTELRNAHLLNYNTAWIEYQLDNKRWYLLGSPLQGTISGEWYAPKTTAQQKTTYYDPVAFRPRYIRVTNPKPTDNPAQNGWYTLSGQTYTTTADTEVDSSKDYYYFYEPASYDRYNPAIYQRSWDKAKAVLYEVGSTYSTDDDSQTANLGSASEGMWSSGSWNVEGADEYLGRLGYKPMGGNKANVAIKGMWSNTYNDAQVDYATGGFTVMVMNHLKGTENDKSGNKAIIRLPKEDTMYDYYEFSQTNATDGGTDTELTGDQGVQAIKNRAKNRGRLKTDKLLPEPANGMTSYTTPRKTEDSPSVYGDMRTYTRVPTTEATLQEMNGANFTFTETVPAGVSNLGYYLVENPFPCGLDMTKFFAANEDVLDAKYWLLTATGQHLVQRAGEDEWITPDGSPINYLNPNYVEPEPTDPEPTEPKTRTFYPHAVVAPGQGFFVKAKSGTSGDLTVTFNRDMQAQSRFGMKDNEHGTPYTIVVGQAQVMEKKYDSNDDGIADTPIYGNDSPKIWVDMNGDGVPETVLPKNAEESDFEGEIIWIDTDDDDQPDTEKNVLNVLVYETDEETGESIPVLTDIEEEVIIYKYVPETLSIPDDESTPDVDETGTTEKEYPLLSRRTRSTDFLPMHGLVITAKRGADKSSALVMKRESASDDFLPAEDTETFIIGGELQSPAVPTVYTLCGRLATTINSIHDFRCLPLGVESNSEAPCTLTFEGVELLGDSVAFYDAVEQKLTPLESGMKFTVSGQTQNRYYLVSTLIKEEAAAETHLQIFTEGHTAKVIASTAEPITNVRCFDAAGRLVHSASPQTKEYSFTLPDNGVYIIEAQTEKDRKTKKVAVK